jgi:translation initiation factor 2B subunit (eIF-2B alpha/beta/delta family)
VAVNAAIRKEIEAIAADSRSSASDLLVRGIAVLRAAAAEGKDALAPAAHQLCRAQPAMAGLRTGAALALAADDPAAALDEFAARLARAPSIIARHTASLLALRTGTGPLAVVTYSNSRTVEAALRLVAERQELVLHCAEGRPALEGRNLATSLAAAGVPVEIYTDAALVTALPGADALLVGADAICADRFINKAGTSALCTLAGALGTPAYVLSGREKILPDDVFAALTLRPGSARQVWRDPPVGVHVRNPYFESIPVAWVASVVTDAGVLQTGDIAQAGLWRNKI